MSSVPAGCAPGKRACRRLADGGARRVDLRAASRDELVPAKYRAHLVRRFVGEIGGASGADRLPTFQAVR